MGSKIDVGFGAKPMLVTWVDGKLPEVNVNSDDVKFGPAVGMQVQATFRDIEVTDNGRGAPRSAAPPPTSPGATTASPRLSAGW